jgi:seryl-tRNA synthetase
MWAPGHRRDPDRGTETRELLLLDTTDYRARSLEVRHRPEEGAAPRAHAQWTAVAVGGTIIAIAEYHQREDGTVEVPRMLRKFGAAATI